MATATVSRSRLQAGDLPRLCVKTGEAADGTVHVTFATLPAWTYWLLLAGIFPFLIALAFAGERIPARLPISRRALDRYHRLTRLAWICLGAAVTGGVAAFVGAPWAWPLAAFAVIAALLTALVRAAAWVHAEPVRGTSRIRLRGVSDEFATAVARQPSAS